MQKIPHSEALGDWWSIIFWKCAAVACLTNSKPVCEDTLCHITHTHYTSMSMQTRPDLKANLNCLPGLCKRRAKDLWCLWRSPRTIKRQLSLSIDITNFSLYFSPSHPEFSTYSVHTKSPKTPQMDVLEISEMTLSVVPAGITEKRPPYIFCIFWPGFRV